MRADGNFLTHSFSENGQHFKVAFCRDDKFILLREFLAYADAAFTLSSPFDPEKLVLRGTTCLDRLRDLPQPANSDFLISLRFLNYSMLHLYTLIFEGCIFNLLVQPLRR